MKFIIETKKGEVVHDFSFTLIQRINAHNDWLLNQSDLIKYKLTDGEMLPDFIPVGSVDFVVKYIRKYYGITPEPVNIPDVLNQDRFLERKVYIDKFTNVLSTTSPLFIKSINKIKGFTGFVSKVSLMDIPSESFLCSEVIDIDSEWRGFVHKNELIDIKNYSGDPFIFPNVDTVKEMVKEYVNAPVAYTIDVAINSKTGNTVLIECHDFFSCGLYGFDYHKYPWMLSQWYYEFLRKNKQNILQI